LKGSDHKLFIKAAYIVGNILDNAKIKLFNSAGLRASERSVPSSGYFGFGIGYSYKNTLSVELRHEADRNILQSRLSTYSGNFRSPLVITIGYNFLSF
jgi:hypothetical protein